MRKGLPYFVFLISLLIAFSGGDAYGQGRESGGKKNDLPPVLRGQEGTIDDLADAYCESSSSPEIYVNPGNLPDPADYDYVVWELYFYDGGGSEVYRNDLLNPVGAAPNNGVELDIAQIASEGLFNTFLVIEYSFRRGLGTFGGDFDYTIVRKDPTDFNLTIDNSEICLGETATLTLDGSESGYLYYLYRDGVLQNTVGRNGNGNPINFIQSSLPEGDYSYYVVAHVDDDDVNCETQMSGTPTLSVNSVPSGNPVSPNSPVCQDVAIELQDSNPEVSGYIYTWYGPGLDPAGVTGHSITVSDPGVIGTAGDYDYDLTIVDSNNATGCSNTSTVTVTVLERPDVTPTNDGPVCDGATNVSLYANPSGGSGDYSFSWTSNPAGFSSTDENPVLASVAYGVDNIEYIVDVTDNITGCGATTTGSTNLVIHENPAVVIPEGDQTVCQEQDVTYTTNVSGSGTYTYQWYLDGNPLAGETVSGLTINGASLPAVGNHSVSVEVIDTSTGTNCSSTESVQLTVNEKPEVEIVGPVEACAGDNITFDANLLSGPGAFPADYTISWTTPYGSESGDSFTINNVDDATHSGTYTLNIVYDATGCADQVQIDLTVHTVTPGISANPGTLVCQGTQVEFTGTGGTNYEFLIDDGTGYSVVQGLSGDDTFGPVALNDGDLVKVLVEDVNGCQAESSPLTMVVNELPVIDDIGNNGPYCIDDDPIEIYSSVSGGDISVSGDYTYSWSGPNGFTSNVQNPSFGPATSDRAGIYSLTVTDDNGCVAVVDDTEVIVNSLPSPSATNTGPVCGNGNNNITLVGDPDGLVAYEWYDPDDNFLGAAQDYSLNNVLPDDGGIYTLRVTDANGCENITTTEVIVNEIPVVGIGPDLAACENSDVMLTATISSTTTGPYTYSWYKDDGGGPVQVASGVDLDTYTLTSVDNTDAANYSVVVNDGNGCASASDAMILTINPLPSVNPAGNDICASPDNDILLEGGPDNADYTYSWSGPGLTGSVAGQDVTVTDDAVTASPGVYTYTLTNQSTSTGCSNSANVDVEVFENPVVTVDPVSPICDGGAFTVTANASGGSGDFSFSWTFTPEGGGASSALPFASNTFNINPADINDAGTYEVTVLDNITGCTTISNVVVTVNELPAVTVDDVSTCDGNDATLTAVPAGGSGNYVNYVWSDGGGVIAGENNNTLVLTGADVALANNGANYSVIVEDDNGCLSASDNMTLTVNENPSVQINSGDPDIDVCVGANLTLTANVTGGSGSNSFVWNLPDGSTQTGSPLVVDPVSLSDQGVYTVTVTDGVSCEGTAQVQVNVHEVNPTLSASSTEICDGSSVTFTAGGGEQYEFLLNGVVEQALSATDTWTSSSLSDGDEIAVRVVDTYGCEAVSAPITMTVNANPVVSLSVTSPNGDTPCIGQTVEFTATPGFFNYVYYVDGTEVQNSSNNIFTTDALNDGAVVYVVAESSQGCTGSSGNQTINFDPLPAAGITSDQPSDTACPNELVSFTASGGDTYEFLVDGVSAGAASNDATFIQNAPASGSMEVGVVVTDANSCSDTAYVDILVSEVVPILNATATTICVGNEVTFTAGGGDQYEFFLNGSSIGAPSNDNTYVTSSLSDGDQVYVRVIDQYGCENTSSPITMTVNDNPTVSLSFPGGSNEVCQNSDLVVEATSGYSNYVFFVNGVEVQNSASNIYTSNTFANNDEIYVSASSGVGCSADSSPETIIVHGLPNATAANSGPACEGQTISLLGGDAGLNYEWFAPGDDPTVDSPISTGMDYDLTDVSLGQAGIYTLVVTDGNSCQSIATTDVVVNDLPVVDLGSDIAVCNGTQNYDLTANISGGLSPYNVEWEFEGTSVLSGQDENIYSIANVDNSHEGEYVVTVTDANSCVSVKDTVYLTVNPSPSVSFDLGNSTYEVCDGSQVLLAAEGSGGAVSGSDPSGYEYVWYYEGTLLPGVSTQNYSFTGQNGINDGMYEVVAIDDNGNGCASSVQQIDVVVYQLPSATLDADPAFFIEGTNVDFTAGGGDEYTFYLNGAEVRARGTDNLWSSNTLVDGDSVSVEVYEDHGSFYCQSSAYIIMSVFGNVDQPVVDITNAEYCSGDGGATVTVNNPQDGVTYEVILSDETATSYSSIVYDGSTPVQWTGVVDPNVPAGTDFRI
ncbi:beta strand repeat-containing protein, partial [Marinilabilia sp.]